MFKTDVPSKALQEFIVEVASKRGYAISTANDFYVKGDRYERRFVYLSPGGFVGIAQ